MKLASLLTIVMLLCLACCEKTKEDAKELDDKHRKCKEGDTCVLAWVDGGSDGCLGPFICPSPVNEKNVKEYKREAKELIEDYDHCNECVVAMCVATPESEAYCDVDKGKCEYK